MRLRQIPHSTSTERRLTWVIEQVRWWVTLLLVTNKGGMDIRGAAICNIADEVREGVGVGSVVPLVLLEADGVGCCEPVPAVVEGWVVLACESEELRMELMDDPTSLRDCDRPGLALGFDGSIPLSQRLSDGAYIPDEVADVDVDLSLEFDSGFDLVEEDEV